MATKPSYSSRDQHVILESSSKEPVAETSHSQQHAWIPNWVSRKVKIIICCIAIALLAVLAFGIIFSASQNSQNEMENSNRVCGAFPPAPPNAVVWNSSTEISPGNGPYRSGSFVSYHCNASYFPTAAVTIACQTNGTWETLNLKCLGVDPGWYTPGNGYQYFLTNMTQNWTESQQICKDKGGDLASVGMRNSTVRDKLWDALLNGKETWIGLNDIEEEGNWVWADGAPYVRDDTLWQAGEPNDFRGNEDCGHVGYETNRNIYDDRCDEEKWALCEK